MTDDTVLVETDTTWPLYHDPDSNTSWNTESVTRTEANNRGADSCPICYGGTDD